MAKKDDETDVPAAEPDFSVELTEKEKLALVAEARREVAKEMKAAKATAFKEMAKKRVQAEILLSNATDDTGENLVPVTIDIAGYPKYITLDGRRYWQRPKPYMVKPAVAAVLNDQMDRGWRQEIGRTGEKVELTDQRRKVMGKLGLQYLH